MRGAEARAHEIEAPDAAAVAEVEVALLLDDVEAVAPPLLLSAAVGAAIGAGIGGLLKRSEGERAGDRVAGPPAARVVRDVAVVEDSHLDRIDRALAKSSRKISKAIDKGDYDALRKELSDAGYRVEDAIES